jgi:hypothetical protein
VTFDELCEQFDEMEIPGDTPVVLKDGEGFTYSVEAITKDNQHGTAVLTIEQEV